MPEDTSQRKSWLRLVLETWVYSQPGIVIFGEPRFSQDIESAVCVTLASAKTIPKSRLEPAWVRLVEVDLVLSAFQPNLGAILRALDDAAARLNRTQNEAIREP